MKNKRISILDYGFGNLTSLQGCLNRLGYSVNISDKKSVLRKGEILFLPGVGSFDAGIKAMHKLDLVNFISDFKDSGKTVVGICLGMQLLFSSSDEGESIAGLGFLPGKIKKVQSIPTHIGWNKINVVKKRTIFKKFHDQHFYFNHGYYYSGKSAITHCAANIGKKDIPSIVKKSNVIGMQFHPEKSQRNGESLLKTIVEKFNHA
jgi:glutamine amidotransferase